MVKRNFVLLVLLACLGLPFIGHAQESLFPVITTASLPDGVYDVHYWATLEAKGGSLPYQWRVYAETLPSGLSLCPKGGTISGTPDKPGEYHFAIQVMDKNGYTDERKFCITIEKPGAPLEITTTALPDGTYGSEYTAMLTAKGGYPPYQWKIDGDYVPELKLCEKSGKISGTTVKVGTFQFTVLVIDSKEQVAKKGLGIIVNKATATVTLGDLIQTYTGEPLYPTVTTDPEGLDIVWTNAPQVDAGSYGVTAIVDDPNYEGSAAGFFLIQKADAKIDVQGVTVTYDGEEHGATGTATGVQGEDLSGDLDLGATFVDVPGGTANWSFTDTTGNYNDASGSVDIVIKKADAVIDVEGTTVTYDGEAHGATGTATGVQGEDLSGDLDLGATFVDVPGGTANWTFTDSTGNYNDATGPVEIVIFGAGLTITADDQSKRYDAEPFTDFTVSFEGFVGGEGPEVLGGALTFSGEAVGAMEPGSYPIIPGGLTSDNYTIVYQAGLLRIRPYYEVALSEGAIGFLDRAVAGGAGTFEDLVIEALYEIGTPIVITFSVTGYYGEEVTDAIALIGLMGAEARPRPVVYLEQAVHDEELELYYLEIPTEALKPGLYFLDITLNDGSHFQELFELVEPIE